MAWREKPSLSPDEARALHAQALVIDSQQPPVTSGFLFTEHMREQMEKVEPRRCRAGGADARGARDPDFGGSAPDLS